MNLQDQGYRFILRLTGTSVDAKWEHPALIRPTDRDITNFTDDEMTRAIYDMEDFAMGGKPDSEF